MGQSVTDEEIRSLQIEAELYSLATWFGGMLPVWQISDKTEEELMGLVAAIKAFCAHVRGSEAAQNELLEQTIGKYKGDPSHPLGAYIKEAMAPHIKEADEAAAVFEVRIQTKQEKRVSEESANEEANPDEQKVETYESLVEHAVWTQPKGQQHPIQIGKAKDLGMNASFTALCWVKNEKAAVDDHHRDRNAIFIGDLDPKENGKEWHDYKSEILHMELRHENRFYFGFGWDDTSSNRMCRIGEWDHVAFVYTTEGENEGK